MRGLRSDLHVDAVVAYVDRERLGPVDETRRRGAIDRAIVVAVPRTPQPTVLDGSFTQRAALMRAMVVERAVASVAMGERERAVSGLHRLHTTVGQLIEISDPMPLGHELGMFCGAHSGTTPPYGTPVR